MATLRPFVRYTRTFAIPRQQLALAARKNRISKLNEKMAKSNEDRQDLEAKLQRSREILREIYIWSQMDLPDLHIQTTAKKQERLALYEKEGQKLEKKLDELSNLLGGAFPVKTKTMLVDDYFNLRGALGPESIVYQGIILGKIISRVAVQDALDQLSTTDEFITVLDEEVRARGLLFKEVADSVGHLYSKLCKEAEGNDRTLTVRANEHSPNECAALVTILKVQSKWPDPFDWREDKTCDGDNGKM
ncbi:unnamed protein product [Tuber aestivum]|uniref:Uncharacterized protein n=1 Tax=Tuber aestivum TaxID=59557 RepID=A0A292PY90_9PEZI|nr:unnamed protein product [Tuber aestivum]